MDSLLTHPIIIIIFLVFTAISFFLSASETSIIGLSRIRLRHLMAKGSSRAQSVHRLVTKIDKFIVAILVANNFVNIAMSAIITSIFVKIFGYNWGVVTATFFTTFFILVFCEITPKLLAAKHTEKLSLFAAPIMDVVISILSPLIRIFIGISELILKILRIEAPKRSPLITEEELRTMIEVGKEEGVLSEEERKMLQRIFEFGDTKVQDVMVPREKMVAVDINTTPEQLLNIFVEQGHARLPVYKDTPDNVVGIVYAHDLLYVLRDKGLFLLQDLIHEPYTVSRSMRVNDLLKILQLDKIQIAIVADEHKKALGLVTLEDLVEEIVGEIEERPQRKRPRK